MKFEADKAQKNHLLFLKNDIQSAIKRLDVMDLRRYGKEFARRITEACVIVPAFTRRASEMLVASLSLRSRGASRFVLRTEGFSVGRDHDMRLAARRDSRVIT